MPEILYPLLYEAVFNVARLIFTNTPDCLNPYYFQMAPGTALYRYVSYRNLRPQDDEAGRGIWTVLNNDTSNRWTGRGTAGSPYGCQGLYLSGEFVDETHPFPELEHYQNPNADQAQGINLIQYRPREDPREWTVNVSELRTMFLFSLTSQLTGINLSLQLNGMDHPLLSEIMAQALEPGYSLVDLYTSAQDASFDRAIGNALFLSVNADCFLVTSVRDRMSPNIIIKGQTEIPVDCLQAQGRVTYYIDPNTRLTTSGYTLDDLRYNNQLGQNLENTVPQAGFVNAYPEPG